MTAVASGRLTVALGLVTMLTGCAHATTALQPLKVEIDAAPSSIEVGVVHVVLTNLTSEERCIRSDILENPISGEIGTRLRFRGRVIPKPPAGYLMPPRAVGLYHLPSAGQVSFRLDMRGRYESSGLASTGPWEMRAGIYSTPCSSPYVGSGSTSWSDWTGFSYPSP